MQTKEVFTKSPINYPGGKYKLLKQLIPLFPPNINNFVDLFCGGLDVSCNISANIKYANDLDSNLINIYKSFQTVSFEELLNFINKRIKEFELTKYNYDGFIRYRTLYNNNSDYHSPLDLFILSRFSYNNLIRVKDNKCTSSFGFDHSDFNITQRAHTKFLYEKIQNIIFSCENFINFKLDNFTSNDFLYVDPPYLISANVYNNIWSTQDEQTLYKYLDKANEEGIKWGVSNIIANKGEVNNILAQWMEKYNVYDINSNYSNSFYSRTKSKNDFTLEVFITNY